MEMTNFAQTMHDWQRMCKYYEEHYNDECCTYCPLQGCGAIWEIDENTNWEKFGHQIDVWSQTHQYPTWREYLKKKGLATSKNVYFSDENSAGIKLEDRLTEKADQPIPAEIAIALGLESLHE